MKIISPLSLNSGYGSGHERDLIVEEINFHSSLPVFQPGPDEARMFLQEKLADLGMPGLRAVLCNSRTAGCKTARKAVKIEVECNLDQAPMTDQRSKMQEIAREFRDNFPKVKLLMGRF